MVKQTALALLVFATAIAQAEVYSYRAEDGSLVFTDEPTKGAKGIKIEEPMTVPAFKPKARAEVETPRESPQPLWPEPEATVYPHDAGGDIPVYDESANTSWSVDTQGVSTMPKSSKKSKATSPPKLADRSMIQRASKSSKKASKKSSGGSVYQSFKVLSPTPGSSRWVGGELTVELALKPGLQPEHVISLRVDGREVAVGPELRLVVPGVFRGEHTVRAAVLDVDSGKQLMVSDKVRFQVHRASKKNNTSMLHPSIQNKNSQ